MIKIILTLALLQYIINFIFGTKTNILSCGIFGQASNKPESLDVNAVHILGIYNIERGKMSCGLTWDGDIQYGLGFDKLYTDFIIDREIKPISTPIIFGHTRQPSYGTVITEYNAHPFGFGENKNNDSYGMIFCHNGTLKNHKELAKKYEIDITESLTKFTVSGTPYNTTRDKIDSEILGEILFKTKKFHVLSEYIGAAALVWTWLDEPNKIYLWSGSSKDTKGSQYGVEKEERPLNVFCRDDNNMFFSSLKDSLTVLGASSKNDLQIDYNTVYIVTDGDFANAEKHKVSRLQAGQSEAIVNNSSGRNYAGYNEYCDFEDYYGYKSTNVINNTKKEIVPSNNFSMTNLHEDKPIKPITNYLEKVYCKSLRYWKNGQVINGVYIYIKNWGFKLAGSDQKTAISHINIVKGETFNYERGNFDYEDKGETGFVPFNKDVKSVQFHYFVDGVMLKSLIDYNKATDLKRGLTGPLKYINVDVMSYMAKHPIVDMDITTPTTIAILEGKNFTGNITELGFEKIYYFNNGILTKWSKREDLVENKQVVIELPATTVKKTHDAEILKDSIEQIEKFEKDNKEKFNPQVVVEESDILFIEELISDVFQRHSEELTETLVELSDWKDNESVKAALETLKLITHTLKDFVENSNKK